jgi:hypothetical protein
MVRVRVEAESGKKSEIEKTSPWLVGWILLRACALWVFSFFYSFFKTFPKIKFQKNIALIKTKVEETIIKNKMLTQSYFILSS